ncbi:uncharacterized protein LOC122392593 [Amphibalanus amphitrite]|uniref:uncharacterized protein LOC122392593 n=1 Tax=Amphibalanus amphitrite TaxID=1232801 RepID=UPI001C924C45|nr:uncharacterized protein LOC122392593 [Amphibalanus amphitrite]
MTELRAPTAETDTDLRLVAATCHALEKANLRGFKLRVSALRRLGSLCPAPLTNGHDKYSPSVTPEATGRLLAALTGLKDVTLVVSGVISETVLAALHGCSQLDTVQLSDTRPLADIPALTQSEVAAVSRIAVTCRKLKNLHLTSSLENRQAVLTALHETDLGFDGGQSRTIYLWVSKSVYDKLTKPPNDSKVSLYHYK